MPQTHSLTTRAGKTYDKSRTVMFLTLHLNPATMQIDNSMYSRQTQSRPLFLGRKERKENLAQKVLGDTLSGIAKRNLDHVALLRSHIDLAPTA